MNNKGATGIATAILLIAFILISATAASVLMNDSGPQYEKNYEELLDDTLNQISTYIQIKDVLGKYTSNTEEQQIQKIAILIKPLFSIDIDTSQLLIQINNGKQIKILSYNNHAEFILSHSLFEHPLWQTMNENTFSFIPILDKDQSIIKYNTINDNTDIVYIILQLSNDFAMQKGENLEITLFPATGITKTITLTAPLPIKNVVSLY